MSIRNCLLPTHQKLPPCLLSKFLKFIIEHMINKGLFNWYSKSFFYFLGQGKKKIVCLSIACNSDSQKTSFLSLSIKIIHHLGWILCDHQNKITENPIKRSLFMHLFLSVTALQNKMVHFVITIFFHQNWNTFQRRSNCLFGHFYHIFRYINAQIRSLSIFDTHNIGYESSSPTPNLVNILRCVELQHMNQFIEKDIHTVIYCTVYSCEFVPLCFKLRKSEIPWFLLNLLHINYTLSNNSDLRDEYNQMIESSKKQDIIIEVGSEYIRVGLVGDKVPRKTIKSAGYMKYFNKQPENFEIAMEQLLYNIFFSYINCACQGKTVIVLQKVYTDRRILESMFRIMFKKLKIQKIELALSCVTPLYLTGRYSGLVVSAGASSIEFMPIFEGYPLFQCYQCLNIGTQNLNKYIRDDIALLNKQISLDVLKQITDQEINQQIKNTYGSIPASNTPVSVAIRNKLKIKWIPDKINYSIFYGNSDNEQQNISYTLLKVLDSLPYHCLPQVAKNVVLSGGFWRIKGMQRFFKKKIAEELDKFPKLCSSNIKDKLGFVSWSFNPSDVAWIGCSIGASIRSIELLSMKKSEYLEHGFTEKIMKTYFLSG